MTAQKTEYFIHDVTKLNLIYAACKRVLDHPGDPVYLRSLARWVQFAEQSSMDHQVEIFKIDVARGET
jgi:hypothetical protein